MSDILVFKEVNGCFMLEEDMSMKDRIFSKAKDIKESVVCVVSNKRNIGTVLTGSYIGIRLFLAIRKR